MKPRFRSWHEVALAVALVAVLGIAAKVDPAFVSLRAQNGFSTLVWCLFVMALPMTLIVLTGGIDLSVGATMSLSAVSMGLIVERGAPLPLAIAASLLVGTMCGALNGLFVTKVRIHPLIVTLATMSAFFGLAEGISHARPISGFPPTLSVWFSNPAQASLALLLAVAVAVFVKLTPSGQALFSIGHNETAVRFSGLSVDKIKFWAYTLSGTVAGLAAVFFIAHRNTAKADIGQGLELDVVTAVVLGGTSVTGGKGSVLGTILGVALVHETRQFVSWHWERDEINQIVIGSMLILTVLLKKVLERRSDVAQ